MLVHRRVTPSIKFAGTHLYTWVERGTVSVLPMNTTQCPRPGLEPGLLDPESSAQTMRPPRLPQSESHTYELLCLHSYNRNTNLEIRTLTWRENILGQR